MVLVWCWYGVGMVLVWCWYGVGMVLMWCWYDVGMVRSVSWCRGWGVLLRLIITSSYFLLLLVSPARVQTLCTHEAVNFRRLPPSSAVSHLLQPV